MHHQNAHHNLRTPPCLLAFLFYPHWSSLTCTTASIMFTVTALRPHPATPTTLPTTRLGKPRDTARVPARDALGARRATHVGGHTRALLLASRAVTAPCVVEVVCRDGRWRGPPRDGPVNPQGALVRAVSKPRGAEEAATVLGAGRVEARRLSHVISALGRDGTLRALDWTWTWANEQHGLVNVLHYNSYITQFGRRGQWRDAEGAFMAMRAAGLQPDAITYCALVSAYGKGKQWKRAEAAFALMQNAGVQPNVATFNALIGAYQKGKQWQLAERAFEAMKAARVQPNVATYCALVSAYEKGKQWKRAEAAFESMDAAGLEPNVCTYSALISAYEKGAQWERAEVAFESMEAAGLEPDVCTYSALISAFAKGAQWQRAMEVFEAMQAAGVQPSAYTYSALLSAYAKGAQWERAEAAFEAMKAAGVQPDAVTYNAVLQALWQTGQRHSAIMLFKHATDVAVFPPLGARKLDLHGLSPGAAMAATTLWLASVRRCKTPLRCTVTVVTGWGKHSRCTGECEVKRAVVALLHGSPFEQPKNNPGRLQADGVAVQAWLRIL